MVDFGGRRHGNPDNDANPLRDPLNEQFAPVGEVPPKLASRMEAMAIALSRVRDKDGLRVMLRLPWVAIHAMALAAEDPEKYIVGAFLDGAAERGSEEAVDLARQFREAAT
jgi:hypothetical protein